MTVEDEVYDLIVATVAERGWPPTLTEVCATLGMTRTHARVIVRGLHRDGRIDVSELSL